MSDDGQDVFLRSDGSGRGPPQFGPSLPLTDQELHRLLRRGSGEEPGRRIHVAYRLMPDDYRGGDAIQLVVVHREAAAASLPA